VTATKEGADRDAPAIEGDAVPAGKAGAQAPALNVTASNANTTNTVKPVANKRARSKPIAKKETKPVSTSTDVLKDRKDGGGNLIDPPVIAEFEQRLTAAHNTSDDLLIQEITEEYEKERVKVATADLKREQKRAKS
jgi:hypothetical protein